MPTTKSAKKDLRQSRKQRLANRIKRTQLRSAIKKFRLSAAGDDSAETESKFRIAVKKLDQAAAKHLIHRNAAARTKSRLSKLLPTASAD